MKTFYKEKVTLQQFVWSCTFGLLSALIVYQITFFTV